VNFELEAMKTVDGNPERCTKEEAEFWAIYERLPLDAAGVRVAKWLLDCADGGIAEAVFIMLNRPGCSVQLVRRS
jgi:hypothetical protein